MLLVCTPEWLVKNVGGHVWGRHILVIREFEYERLISIVEEQIDRCSGRHWHETAEKLATFFDWEFEDYQS